MTTDNHNSIFTGEIIYKLIDSNTSGLAGLREVYARLPATRCKRKTHCCSMMPELTLLEALAAFQRLAGETVEFQRRVVKNIVKYFFINPVRITACPFLDEETCMIYEDRFFGCRAYGLWSKKHYENMARQSRDAKLSLGRIWQGLGIALPEKVINFQTPYCLDVRTVDGTMVDDSALIQMACDIDAVSAGLSPWHRRFKQKFFSDLSFLTAAMIYDINHILRKKVDIVRDFVSAGRSDILDELLANIPDMLKKWRKF
jgi:Fe-S-cluster containining protein